MVPCMKVCLTSVTRFNCNVWGGILRFCVKFDLSASLFSDIVRVFEEAWDQCEADCPLYYN